MHRSSPLSDPANPANDKAAGRPWAMAAWIVVLVGAPVAPVWLMIRDRTVPPGFERLADLLILFYSVLFFGAAALILSLIGIVILIVKTRAKNTPTQTAATAFFLRLLPLPVFLVATHLLGTLLVPHW